MIRVRVLGPLTAEVDGHAVDLGGPRQRAVLALLVTARGDVVPVDRLIEDLWRGEPPRKASASLQAYVSNLRRLLEPHREPRTPASVLVSAPPGYALKLERVDAWEFERALTDAVKEDDPRESLAKALRLWRGPAFAEFADEPWAGAEAARLAELRVVARERLVEATIRAGAAAEAVPAAQVLTREHPLREEAWRLLALALYAAGRQADALASLREARRILADELGLDPGAALQDTEAAILGQRIPLPRVDPAVPRAHPAPLTAVSEELFVGRAAELAGLASAATAAAGAGAVALVAGEAGSGKSALLRRLERHLTGTGWRVVKGRCPEADGAPPAWAWVEALRDLRASVPPPEELAAALEPLLTDDAGDRTDGRFRLHRAVAAWLGAAAGDRPLAVVLDDLHRGDAETLALVTSVAAERVKVLLVAAYRPLDGGPPFDDALATLARHSPHRVSLAGLGTDDAATLVAAVAGGPVDGDTVRSLAERTGGNPFYLRESARLLASEGALVAVSEVPEGVRDVLRRRLGRLPPPAVAVLRLAAAVGREADVDLLVDAADTDEDGVLDALEAGLIAGLLTEPGPGRVRFVHALVRDTLYADLSHLRRARVHARLAAALDRIRPHDLPALAHHHTRGLTADTAERAVAANLGAAELAERRYAYDAAAELYEQALTCLGKLPATEERAVDLLGRLLRARIRTGEIGAARRVRERAVAVAEDAGREDLVLAAFTAWTAPSPWEIHRYGEVDRPIVDRLERLIERTADPVTRCRLLCAFGAELTGESDPRAIRAASEALALARASGDPELTALAMVTVLQERLYDRDADRRAVLAGELAELAQAPEMAAYRWYAEHASAQVAAARCDLPAMRRHLTEGLDLARVHQLSDPQDVGTIGLATYAHVTGDFATAERLYLEVGEHMRRRGSLHADYLVLALFTLRTSQGRLAELEPLVGSVRGGRGDLAADAHAATLVAAGRLDDARRLRGTPPPLRHDYFGALWATIRAMVVTALELPDEAEELIEFLEPVRGQLAAVATCSVAMRPVAHSLGDLSLLLGRERDAADYFAEAVTVARRCSSEHWVAPARAALARLQARSK
ncbi:BTAD domain-containing putative transcriptional regulator [Virgisporangium ochraceum]|uniref:ATPase AAA n=1 Tax=Virgisporangium ochraceum TaxID=65505 RepID=A0A8J3ZT53_9ACTN|nr:BTAD domain-containing putative transcriptional regulator [Virgisporangium ochraceum]GIJ70009.1 ATPase AAA [Virgisporangium ochraceum]